MAADLAVALDGRRTLEQVKALHNGVGAVPAPDGLHGALNAFFPLQRVVVGKKVQLINAVVNGCRISVDAQAAVEQPVVRLLVELRQQGLGHDGGGVGPLIQPDGAGGVFRVQPAVEVDADRTVIVRADLQAFPVIAHPPGEGPGDQVL